MNLDGIGAIVVGGAAWKRASKKPLLILPKALGNNGLHFVM